MAYLQRTKELVKLLDLNTVYVDSADDFPTPVAGVSTLAFNTLYKLRQTVVVTFSIEAPANSINHIQCDGVFQHLIVYIGFGSLLTGSSFILYQTENLLLFDGIGGFANAFNITGGGIFAGLFTAYQNFNNVGFASNIFNIFQLTECSNLVCNNGITFTDNARVGIELTGFTSFNNVGGTFLTFLTTNVLISTATNIIGCALEPQSTEFVLFIDPAVNLATSQVIANPYPGGGTFLKPGSIDGTDVRIAFTTNGFQPDSDAVGSFFFIDNATETVISAINTPVVIAGTPASSALERFTFAGSALTYIGREPITIRAEAIVTIQATAGLETDEIEVNIFIDGVKQTTTVDSVVVGTVFQDPTLKLQSVNHIKVVTGNVIDVRIENKSTTTNILVSELKLLVRK